MFTLKNLAHKGLRKQQSLTHCGLIMPYGNTELGQQLNIASGNGLLPDGIKSLLKSWKLNSHVQNEHR